MKKERVPIVTIFRVSWQGVLYGTYAVEDPRDGFWRLNTTNPKLGRPVRGEVTLLEQEGVLFALTAVNAVIREEVEAPTARSAVACFLARNDLCARGVDPLSLLWEEVAEKEPELPDEQVVDFMHEDLTGNRVTVLDDGRPAIPRFPAAVPEPGNIYAAGIEAVPPMTGTPEPEVRVQGADVLARERLRLAPKEERDAMLKRMNERPAGQGRRGPDGRTTGPQ